MHNFTVEDLKKTNGQVITCKAAVAWKPNQPLDYTDIQVDVPRKGEVRIKVIANALCHTDVYTLDGQDPEGKFPCILGHEATAVVESVGEGVTSLVVGDIIIPCYTPECKELDCIFCQSKKTNLCPKIRAFQGQGVMIDGSSRFSKDGQVIYHFMGCSTFSEYSVIAEISAAKINKSADLNQVCMLGCGVSTGWGAVWNTCKVEAQSSVVVFGLGAVGLSVVQAAKLAGARLIIGVDLNSKKKDISVQFGVDVFVNPSELAQGVSIKDHLLSIEKWGYDYTFDCTGNTKVMRDALELAHRGWGESCVIGVAASGHEIQTRPFQLVTGRVWKGTAFGGWKSRSEVPHLVNRVITGELPIEKYVTHTMEGLEKVNEAIDVLHQGECLRAVVKISQLQNPNKDQTQQPFIESTQVVKNGKLLRVKHWSQACQCEMKFSIYLPETKRGQNLPPILYYLSGLTCSDENVRTKGNYLDPAAEYRIALVFPDTSPRGETVENIEGITNNWDFGIGAGFYVDATQEPYKTNFNMYTYIQKELPSLITKFFPVDGTRQSIMGHSMGGHGALVLGLRNPGQYKSVSAFSPVVNPTQVPWGQNAFKKYLGSVESGQIYDATELVKNHSSNERHHFLIDQGSKDNFLKIQLRPELLKQVLENKKWPFTLRIQEGYDHSYFFVASFMRSHIDHHAKYLGQVWSQI